MTSENINTPELGFTPKGLFIGGQWEDSSSGKRFETINPSNQQYLGEVPLADEKDVNRAVRQVALDKKNALKKLLVILKSKT